MEFDVVVDWIGFKPGDVERDLGLFRHRTAQYIYISSASVYEKPVKLLPLTEETPLGNPFWQYSRDKIACEERLMRAYKEANFPVTIIRPSYTYDKMTVPVRGGYTVIDRMRRGKPVVVHGDGTAAWVLTHHRDFARGFIGLMGRQDAAGEAFHITSDEILTWDRIHQILADAAGAEYKPVHVPSEVIARYDSEWGASLLGDKCHSSIFDNRKIKRLVPEFKAEIAFSEGVKEIINWYNEDSARQKADPVFDKMVDMIIEDHDQ
jgi:nucleoside-diphosphate-sugar epimerase